MPFALGDEQCYSCHTEAYGQIKNKPGKGDVDLGKLACKQATHANTEHVVARMGDYANFQPSGLDSYIAPNQTIAEYIQQTKCIVTMQGCEDDSL